MAVPPFRADPGTGVHRRYNPLNGEWILVSPHRASRPWQGHVETPPAEHRPAYDPGCYLCPGNARANGAINPAYSATFVFDNDFAALEPGPVGPAQDVSGLLITAPETGQCRVICYSPRHDLSLGQMPTEAIARIVDTWVAETLRLGAEPEIRSVLVFENRGALMGASNPHPHGQVWANATPPNEMCRETEHQRRYAADRGSCLLCDYAALEVDQATRVVALNPSFVAVVPYWAVWPFETLVLPRRHVAALPDLTATERTDFAAILKEVNVRYDALFSVTFPYSMGLHQQPTDGGHYPEWHLHAHFYPPLLRSATVRKFMVGYELLGGPQRDLTPEAAAERLRGGNG